MKRLVTDFPMSFANCDKIRFVDFNLHGSNFCLHLYRFIFQDFETWDVLNAFRLVVWHMRDGICLLVRYR